MTSRLCFIVMAVVVMVFSQSVLLCAEENDSEVAPAGAADLSASPVNTADVVPPAPVSSIASQCVPDTEVFRRTPKIDGLIDDGEWDIFYIYNSGDWSAVTYADWDSKNLYMAAKSNKPFDFMSVLDANADGWFHGDENYEIQALRGADGVLALQVGRYESKNTKSPVAEPVSDAQASMLEMKGGKDGDWYTVEIRMPALAIRDFRLRDKQKIGLNIMLRTVADEAGWVPSNQVGDVKECTLVSKKFATLKPLELGFDLRESVVARGDTLSGRFHLTNSGTEQLDVRSFVIGGEGNAAEHLSSQRVRLEGLDPRQHISHNTSTLVPSDMPIGSWAIGAEVRSTTDKVGAGLVSFEVVDPFDLDLRIPTGDVRADVKDVTFAVNVTNNMMRGISGTAKITLPVGWELWRNLHTRDFNVLGGRGVIGVSFKAKPPLGEMGNVPVKIEVTVGKETKVAEGTIRIVNP